MEINKTEAEYRRRDTARLQLQKETGDIAAARDTMFTQASAAAAMLADQDHADQEVGAG
jgi:CPA2 family monovalent cation:H+ antiporter-2/glutathione-regulated potassium-efflux system protein KefB